MAEVITVRHLVKPEDWAESPFVDVEHFDLEVTLRNPGQPGEPEWAVAARGRENYFFTRTGESLALRDVDESNQRDVFLYEVEALDLARDLVDGHLETRAYRNHATAAARLTETRES